MIATVGVDQTAFDVVLQHLGSLDGFESVFKANSNAVVDGVFAPPGTEIDVAGAVLNVRVVNSFLKRPPASFLPEVVFDDNIYLTDDLGVILTDDEGNKLIE